METKVELYEDISLKDILKSACKEFNMRDKYKAAKLYNKQGLQMLADDISYISAGEILYMAVNGKFPTQFLFLFPTA